MDKRDFDNLARTFSNVQSRRGILGTVGAIALGVIGLSSAEEAEAKGKGRKRTPPCRGVGHPCVGNGNTCCPDLTCGPAPNPGADKRCCIDTDSSVACDSDGDCCGELTCIKPKSKKNRNRGSTPNGHCSTVCKPVSDKEACGDKICGTVKNNCGIDVPCGKCEDGQTCSDDQKTCSCVAEPGACGTAVCGTVKDSCGDDVDCGKCQTGKCENGICVETCIAPGKTCDIYNDECCQGYACIDGKCCVGGVS